jgi:hypothetical protein
MADSEMWAGAERIAEGVSPVSGPGKAVCLSIRVNQQTCSMGVGSSSGAARLTASDSESLGRGSMVAPPFWKQAEAAQNRVISFERKLFETNTNRLNQFICTDSQTDHSSRRENVVSEMVNDIYSVQERKADLLHAEQD